MAHRAVRRVRHPAARRSRRHRHRPGPCRRADRPPRMRARGVHRPVPSPVGRGLAVPAVPGVGGRGGSGRPLAARLRTACAAVDEPVDEVAPRADAPRRVRSLHCGRRSGASEPQLDPPDPPGAAAEEAGVPGAKTWKSHPPQNQSPGAGVRRMSRARAALRPPPVSDPRKRPARRTEGDGTPDDETAEHQGAAKRTAPEGWRLDFWLGSPLPAVLPAVSRSASRFLTRSDPHRPPISPTNTGFLGFSSKSGTGSKPGALSN